MAFNSILKDDNRKRLRVAFLVESFPAFSETFILDQITGLLDSGQDVDIYALKQAKGPQHAEVERYKLLERVRFLKKPTTKIAKLSTILFLALRVAVQHPIAFWGALSTGSNCQDLSVGLKMLRLLESLGKDGAYYDIIHCHYGTVGRHFLLIKRVIHTKYIVSFHGHDLFVYGNRGKKVYRRMFKMADLILANSGYTMKQLIALGCPSDKIMVQPTGIFTPKFPFRPRTLEPGSAIKLLTVARLVEVKGLEYAIKAVAKLAPQYHIEYQIVGEGPLRPQLESLIHQLGLGSTVFLLGACAREKVSELMNKAHLFIFPSVTTRSGQQESGGIVHREAQASGMPVIATNTGGIPEGLQNGRSGFLVPERDVDALADRLEYLINNSDIWPEMGMAGRRFIEENFDIKIMNERLIEIYYGLFDGQGIE